MSRGEARGLILVGVKLEPEDHAALEAYAARDGSALGTAARQLLVAALRLQNEAVAVSEEELQSRGYREGLRRATHRVRDELTKLFKEDP